MENVIPKCIPKANKIEIQTNITAQICNFIKEVPSKYETEKHLTVEEFDELILQITIFNSGSKLEYRGYVTIEILVDFKFQNRISTRNSYMLNSFVSLIDNSGNKRFTRTFSKHKADAIGVLLYLDVSTNKYLSRQTLLNDPDELLPNDILTIEIDMYFVLDRSSSYNSKIERNIWMNNLIRLSCQSYQRRSTRLLVNSEVTNTLCEVSNFFRDCLALTAGDNSEFLDITIDDFVVLTDIFKMVKGIEYEANTLEEIFELLRVSDKYDIRNIPEICRYFIKNFLGSEMLSSFAWKQRSTLELLMWLAYKSRDAIVLELVEAFVKSRGSRFELEDVEFTIPAEQTLNTNLKRCLKFAYEPSFDGEPSFGGFMLLTQIIPDEDRSNSYYN